VHIAIHGAGGKEVWMMGGEVDIGDGPAVALQRMLDGTRRRVISQV